MIVYVDSSVVLAELLAVRTLDAIHLAAALYMADRRNDLHLATYDKRMADCAAAVGLRLFPLPP